MRKKKSKRPNMQRNLQKPIKRLNKLETKNVIGLMKMKVLISILMKLITFLAQMIKKKKQMSIDLEMDKPVVEEETREGQEEEEDIKIEVETNIGEDIRIEEQMKNSIM